jgi:FlaA1/EpsC-like NDP-sugar epimerase
LTPATIDTAALLGRRNRSDDVSAAAENLREARVLITGAGGSIGSSLSQALCDRVHSLILLDHHEHSLHDLVLALSDATSRLSYLLADVRNTSKMRRLFERERPTHVFHLAAYKHVPFGEMFPEETVSVNVAATRQMLHLSTEMNVSSFVYPSSDKAVNPPSLYGATKRLGEVATQQTAQAHDRRFTTVRYVNVIGTRGSVIETFSRQLAARQALSVTSAKMTRYWMTMDEAVWLLLIAATSAQPADILMLAGLNEITVLEMASRLSAMLGFGSSPEVRITGIRPGERLREELLSAKESFTSTRIDGIARVAHEQRESQLAIPVPSFHDTSDLPHDVLTARVMDLARQLQ